METSLSLKNDFLLKWNLQIEHNSMCLWELYNCPAMLALKLKGHFVRKLN